MSIFFWDVIKFIDDHQGWLTLFIFVIGFFSWKRMHIKERESNYYFNILEKIIALRYLILEIRQPRFLPKQLDQSYIEQSIIPHANKIISHSYEILKSLSSREEILNSKNKCFSKKVFKRFIEKKAGEHNDDDKALTLLYRNKISVPIIKEMSLAITLSLHNAGDDELVKIFFPSENKQVRGRYETDDTGLHVFNDDFHKLVKASFSSVITEIEKLII